MAGSHRIGMKTMLPGSNYDTPAFHGADGYGRQVAGFGYPTIRQTKRRIRKANRRIRRLEEKGGKGIFRTERGSKRRLNRLRAKRRYFIQLFRYQKRLGARRGYRLMVSQHGRRGGMRPAHKAGWGTIGDTQPVFGVGHI